MTVHTCCIEGGNPSDTERCGACQKRNNDRLTAEYELMRKAAFRAADGHPLGQHITRRRARIGSNVSAAR